MIRCLPSTPGYASVTRIDWMISRSLRRRREVGLRPCRLGEQPLADELLGDRRGAARRAAEGVDAGGDDADRVEARVVPERAVLDGRGGVDEHRRDLVERHDVAVELAEPGQLDLAGRGRRRPTARAARSSRAAVGGGRPWLIDGVGREGDAGADDAADHEDAEQDQSHRGRGTDPATPCARPAGSRRGRGGGGHRRRVCLGWRLRAADDAAGPHCSGLSKRGRRSASGVGWRGLRDGLPNGAVTALRGQMASRMTS